MQGKLFLFLFFVLAIQYPLYAEEVTADAAFDKAEIGIGEKVKYSITVDAPKDTKIEFPVIDLTLTGAGFAIKDFGEDKPVKVSKNKIRVKRWYLLDTYVTGSYNVPPAAINYILSDGTKGAVETNDMFLEVKSVMKEGEKAEDIKDIKGPVEIKFNYRKAVIFGIIVLVLAAAAAIAVKFYLKHKKRIESIAAIIPPHVVALGELERIKRMSLDTEEMIKKYYIEISSIVRHYVENRFNLRAPERTTEEFLTELTGRDTLNKEHKGLLRDFLKQCDLVKFAKYGPSKDEIEGVYNSARKFIEDTIPKLTDDKKA